MRSPFLQVGLAALCGVVFLGEGAVAGRVPLAGFEGRVETGDRRNLIVLIYVK